MIVKIYTTADCLNTKYQALSLEFKDENGNLGLNPLDECKIRRAFQDTFKPLENHVRERIQKT